MQRHRGEVLALFKPLAYLLKESDPDGIELYFTMSFEFLRSKRSSKLVEFVEHNPPREGTSNIRLSLLKIIQDYQRRLNVQGQNSLSRRWSHTRARVRPQTLYIFTDGIWEPLCNPADIVASLVKSLKQHGLPREQFGIQFISFGTNTEGLARLAGLDSRLGLEM